MSINKSWDWYIFRKYQCPKRLLLIFQVFSIDCLRIPIPKLLLLFSRQWRHRFELSISLKRLLLQKQKSFCCLVHFKRGHRVTRADCSKRWLHKDITKKVWDFFSLTKKLNCKSYSSDLVTSDTYCLAILKSMLQRKKSRLNHDVVRGNFSLFYTSWQSFRNIRNALGDVLMKKCNRESRFCLSNPGNYWRLHYISWITSLI